jgi:hypothetical protein
MSDSWQMYGDLMSAFVKAIPRSIYGDVRRLMPLAWAVIGLCFTRKVSLPGWSEVVISAARFASSHVRRFARWLTNKAVKPAKWYPYLLRTALKDWPTGQRVLVALDTSVLGPFVIIRTSLIYRGRAIPVAWRILRHASATASFNDYKPVLERTLEALPQGLVIVLLADRGFLHKELIRFAKNRFHYRIRVTGDTQVYLSNHPVTSVSCLCPPPGHAHFYHNVHIFGPRLGPVHLALACPEDQTDDPWFIVSDEPTDLTTLDEYGLRFDIEENFLDDKSNGFQVQVSKLDEPEALSRLFFILAVATLYFTSVGVGVVRARVRRWVDTHWDRGMSYLKIGWAWLRQQYRRGWYRFAPYWLDPLPDPEPAIASRCKAALPKRQWIVSFLC